LSTPPEVACFPFIACGVLTKDRRWGDRPRPGRPKASWRPRSLRFARGTCSSPTWRPPISRWARATRPDRPTWRSVFARDPAFEPFGGDDPAARLDAPHGFDRERPSCHRPAGDRPFGHGRTVEVV